MISTMGVCFHTDFVVCVYAFPCPSWEFDHLFYFGLCISHCFNVEIGATVFPTICGLMWVLFCFSLMWLLLSRFGHDRVKNDSGIGFPYPNCEPLVLLRVCSGWSSYCVGLADCWWPDKPNCVCLLICVFLAMCKPACFYSLGNHAQLGGGSVAERLRSTLAYGWVERCSDVAGCGTNTA